MLSVSLIASLLPQLPPAPDTQAQSLEAGPPPAPVRLLWHDLERDGLPDALVLHSGGAVRLLQNRGSGSFEDVTVARGLPPGLAAQEACWGDFDGDGPTDLLLFAAGSVPRLFRADSAGRFEAPELIADLRQSALPEAVAAIDFDGDGLLDLHLTTAEGQRLFRNVGAGSFEAVELGGPAGAPHEPAVLPAAAPRRGAVVSGQLSDESATATVRPEVGERAAPGGRVPLGTDAPAPGAGGVARSPHGPGTGPGGWTGTTVPLGTLATGASPAGCADTIVDVATMSCVEASSDPQLGKLYPLGPELNIDAAGNVGLGTTTPGSHLHVTDAATSGTMLHAESTALTGSATAIRGTSEGETGVGVSGRAKAVTGVNSGVHGRSRSVEGRGVFGEAVSLTGPALGVYGESRSSDGTGVHGLASAVSGANTGVLGASDSPDGLGVRAENLSDGLNVTALEAEALGSSGTAVAMRARASTSQDLLTTPYGLWASAETTLGLGAGVFGAIDDPGDGPITSPATLAGVVGQNELPFGTGVGGSYSRTSGQGFGVHGESRSPDGIGVRGRVFPGGALSTGTGVHGDVDGDLAVGVHGENASTSGAALGVKGTTDSVAGIAVLGEATAASGSTTGLHGTTASTSGVGVLGEATAASGNTIGVRATVASPGGVAVKAEAAEGVAVEGWSGTDGGFAVAGYATAPSTTGNPVGVYGYCASDNGGTGVAGVFGNTTGAGAGVQGNTSAPDGYGVVGLSASTGAGGGTLGRTDSPDGTGVHGLATSATGSTHGVWGETASPQGTALKGRATAVTGETVGVHGFVSSPDGNAVKGEVGVTLLGTEGMGVVGATSEKKAGVLGWSQHTDSIGIWGLIPPAISASTSVGVAVVGSVEGSDQWGVLGSSDGVLATNAHGVVGRTASGANDAVRAMGNFGGTGAKYFIQPHPSDASKEVRFVCLEGNESGTYFRGATRLAGGLAVIEVPEDFRLVTASEGLTVQLTAVGGPARLWVETFGLDEIVVRGDMDADFHYFVNGVRRGYGELETIRPNGSYVPHERGVPFGTQYPDELRRILVENGTLNPDFTPNEATASRLGWRLRGPEERLQGPVEGAGPADRPAPVPTRRR